MIVSYFCSQRVSSTQCYDVVLFLDSLQRESRPGLRKSNIKKLRRPLLYLYDMYMCVEKFSCARFFILFSFLLLFFVFHYICWIVEVNLWLPRTALNKASKYFVCNCRARNLCIRIPWKSSQLKLTDSDSVMFHVLPMTFVNTSSCIFSRVSSSFRISNIIAPTVYYLIGRSILICT